MMAVPSVIWIICVKQTLTESTIIKGIVGVITVPTCNELCHSESFLSNYCVPDPVLSPLYALTPTPAIRRGHQHFLHFALEEPQAQREELTRQSTLAATKWRSTDDSRTELLWLCLSWARHIPGVGIQAGIKQGEKTFIHKADIRVERIKTVHRINNTTGKL